MYLSVMNKYAKKTLVSVLHGYLNVLKCIVLVALRIAWGAVWFFRICGPLVIGIALNVGTCIYELGGWEAAMGENHARFVESMTGAASIIGYIVCAIITLVCFFKLSPATEALSDLCFDFKFGIVWRDKE